MEQDDLLEVMPFVRQQAEEARVTGYQERKARGARTRMEIETIKGKMAAGLLQGFSPKSLRDALKLPRGTWNRYSKELAAETYAERLKDTQGLLHDYFTRHEKLFQEAMAAYNEPRLDARGMQMTDANGKVIKNKDPRYLLQANVVLDGMFKNLQSAGFIPKAAERMEIKEASVTVDMNDLLRAMKERDERKGAKRVIGQPPAD